jgi:leader peptidase (prepilin peptidase) / N-methyltransferase
MTLSFQYVTAFLIGTCIGSFLNVCIHRLPAGQSILTPGSACPHCATPIAPHHNIPLISYIWLKGRCSYCGGQISVRYPLVELLTGLFAVCICLRYGISIQAFIYFTFTAALITITFIDIDHQIIPDVITLPGIPLALGAVWFLPAQTYLDSIIGFFAGGGTLYIIAILYQWVTGRDGMGGGDIKLLALVGIVTGWKGVLFTLFLGSAVGSLAGVAVMLHSRTGLKAVVPFGPFLSIGAICYIFFGPEVINWYLGFSG